MADFFPISFYLKKCFIESKDLGVIVVFLKNFLEWISAWAHQFHSTGQDWSICSGSVSWDDSTWAFSDENWSSSIKNNVANHICCFQCWTILPFHTSTAMPNQLRFQTNLIYMMFNHPSRSSSTKRLTMAKEVSGDMQKGQITATGTMEIKPFSPVPELHCQMPLSTYT